MSCELLLKHNSANHGQHVQRRLYVSVKADRVG